MVHLPILTYYRITYNDKDINLICAHNSLDKSTSNSRLVFAGQFIFRGKIAEWVYENINGTGTQLQHYLGNVFSQRFIEHFFDCNLAHLPIPLPDEVIKRQKHIFTYSFLGFMLEKASPEELNNFILNEFIFPNDKYLPANFKPKNYWEQLILLCKQIYGKPPVRKETTDVDGKNITVSVHIPSLKDDLGDTGAREPVEWEDGFSSDSEGVVFAATSVSYKYALKKAIRKALQFVAEAGNKQLNESYGYRQRLQEAASKKAEEEKQLKEQIQEAHRIRIEGHQMRMSHKREIDKKLKAEKDRNRRMAKQALADKKKSRKGSNTVYRDYTDEEIAAMSANKRRNLQDKGIIPKGKWG